MPNNAWRLKFSVTKALSFAIILISGLVIVGWILDISFLKRVMPGFISMKMNTAISFLFSGIALSLVRDRKQSVWSSRFSRFCTGLVFLLSFLNLVEYFFHVDLGVDRLFFIDPYDDFTGKLFLGRMSIVTAVNFIFLSTGLILLHCRTRSKLAISLVALPPLITSFLGIVGYMGNVPFLYTPLGGIPMAPHTTVAFFLLSTAILLASFEFESASPGLLKPPKTGGMIKLFALALSILLMIGIASYRNTSLLLKAYAWKAHTHEVLEKIQTLLFSLMDAENANRTYIITGDQSYTDVYRDSQKRAREEFIELKKLTVDNFNQQQRLSRLLPLITKRIGRLDEGIRLRQKVNFEAAREFISNGQGKQLIGQIRGVMLQMSAEERTLLAQRDENTQVGAHNTYATLFIGNVLGFTILGFVFYHLRVEIKEREKAAKALEESREELKVFANDLERRVKEQASLLVHAEKLSALGTMAAGVAHELSNPMMGILNYVQYSLKHMPAENKAYPVLKDAERETRRCSRIIQDILLFARSTRENEAEYHETRCEDLIQQVLKDLQYRIQAEGVSLKIRLNEDAPPIRMKVDNMRRVFLNLITNALDAMKDCAGKTLTIEARRESDTLRIDVSDTGPGITSEVLEKIFDPFFTTKPTGQGTGLGLSISRSIVSEHRGKLNCQSVPGAGTTFSIILPI